MKILFAFGTRPEVIKMAPVIHKAKEMGHEPVVCLSGQHREMVVPFIEFFQVEAHENLDLMRANQTLESVTAASLTGYCQLIDKYSPDFVVVQGDTTSTFAGALAGFYRKVPVAHIEAGLRTDNRYSPFPEELNRRMTSQLSTLHFPPTENSKANLEKEGFRDQVFVTGNTSIDALDFTVEKTIKTPELTQDLEKRFSFLDSSKRMILVTSHRRENLGEGQKNIFQALRDLHEKYDDIQIVFPVHMNPIVQQAAREGLGDLDRVELIEPLDYVSFVWMMDKSYLIMSDSGGVQEEAPHLGSPVLVLRQSTERPEGLDAGTSFLVGTERSAIFAKACDFLDDPQKRELVSKSANPYGNGKAAEAIMQVLIKNLTGTMI